MQNQKNQFNAEFEKLYQEELEYLRSYKKIQKALDYTKIKEQEIRMRMYSLGGGEGEAVEGGVRNEKLINLISTLEKIQTQRTEQIIAQEKELKKIEYQIWKVKHPYDAVLRKYYLEFKNYRQIACELNYSFKQISRGIRKAVVLFSENFKKDKDVHKSPH